MVLAARTIMTNVEMARMVGRLLFVPMVGCFLVWQLLPKNPVVVLATSGHVVTVNVKLPVDLVGPIMTPSPVVMAVKITPINPGYALLRVLQVGPYFGWGWVVGVVTPVVSQPL